MQLLQKASETISPRRCGERVLDVVPSLMQFLRQVGQTRRGRGVTVQQFRALAYLRRRPGDSLSDVADYLGLTPPTASRMIDALVKRGLAVREPVPGNRRQVQLRISRAGNRILDAAIDATLDEIERRLRTVSAQRRRRIVDALDDMSQIFEPSKPFEDLR